MKHWIVPVAFVVSACAAGYGQKEPPPKPFLATKWQLVMDIPPAGELPYVRFGDGRIEGFGGCSKFVGRYIQSLVEFPPRQKPGSFNLGDVLDKLKRPPQGVN